MKINEKVVVGAVSIGLVAALATLFIQPPVTWDFSKAEFHYSLGMSMLALLIHVGAASLFVLSFNVYKQKLQRAFWGIVLGIVLIAFGVVQLPVLDVLDKWNSWYVTNGIIGLPFLVSGLVVYFGGSAFGRLVGDKSVVTNKFMIVPITILLAGATALLPHVQTTVKESSYDIGNIVLSWTMFLLTATALIFFSARRRIGSHYQYAMLWTGIALLGSAICLALAVFDTLVSTATRDHITEVLNVVTVLAGLAWLKAGYIFTKTKEY